MISLEVSVLGCKVVKPLGFSTGLARNDLFRIEFTFLLYVAALESSYGFIAMKENPWRQIHGGVESFVAITLCLRRSSSSRILCSICLHDRESKRKVGVIS